MSLSGSFELVFSGATLSSSAWEFPGYENADTFVNRLVREGLLVHDPVIDVALREQPQLMSRRTVQRRFLRATGLTYSGVFQIQRARYATSLLKQGVSILDTVEQAGYTGAQIEQLGFGPWQFTLNSGIYIFNF